MAIKIHFTQTAAFKKGLRFLSRDPKFRALIKNTGAFDLTWSQPDLFTALVRSIVAQQVSGAAANTIYGRLKALFPRQRLSPRFLLSLSDTQLRRVGLSHNKMLSVQDLARKSVEGHLPKSVHLKKMSDEKLIEQLTRVRGVGEWTAQMILIFQLGRLDVFPHADLGIQKGFQKVHGKRTRPNPKFLKKYAVKWKPYRTVAALYLWRAID